MNHISLRKLFSAFLILFLFLQNFLFFVKPAFAVIPFSDTFSGSTIDAAKWIEHDTGSNVNQDNALTIVGDGAWNHNGVETQSTFSRANSLTIVTRASVSSAVGNYLVAEYGDWNWFGSSGTSNYAVYLKSTGGIVFQYYNNGAQVQSVTAGTYTTGVTYTFKIILKATGADLYIDSGSGYPGTPSAQLTQGTFTDKKVNVENHNTAATLTVYSVTVTDESMSNTFIAAKIHELDTLLMYSNS